MFFYTFKNRDDVYVCVPDVKSIMNLNCIYGQDETIIRPLLYKFICVSTLGR